MKAMKYILSKSQHAIFRARQRHLFRIHQAFSDFTMIPQHTYVTNLLLASRAHSVPGAIVECGTWKGGMIAGMARLLGKGRTYFLFDSFEGLPKVQPIDGPAARKWQEDTAGGTHYNNCTASEYDASAAMALADVANPTIVKGWFKDTLPIMRFPAGIAILRMDADWYESTMQILESLFPAVNEGGLILIDDYFTWEGCSKAVHDYLSRHKRPERINSLNGVCFIVKSDAEQNLRGNIPNSVPHG